FERLLEDGRTADVPLHHLAVRLARTEAGDAHLPRDALDGAFHVLVDQCLVDLDLHRDTCAGETFGSNCQGVEPHQDGPESERRTGYGRRLGRFQAVWMRR